MQTFLVGGSVRDLLLGLTPKDQDWVVVGASPQGMLDLGFIQVGADFPVFLHPQTGDEHALARTERKSGEGYLGFSTEVNGVTLEEDLMRRDLTINAMAMSPEGVLTDPCGGQADLVRRVLRHVGPAFREDPVRVLRVLRLLARFGPSWSIAPETWALLQAMVDDGGASHLVAERVWKEASRALMEPYPELFLQGMQDLGLHHLPGFAAYRGLPQRNGAALARAAKLGADVGVRFAFAFPRSSQDAPKAVPAKVWQVASLVASVGAELPRSPASWLDAFTACGLFRSGAKWPELLQAWEAQGFDIRRAQPLADAVLSVDTKAITASMPPGPQVAAALACARRSAIAIAGG